MCCAQYDSSATSTDRYTSHWMDKLNPSGYRCNESITYWLIIKLYCRIQQTVNWMVTLQFWEVVFSPSSSVEELNQSLSAGSSWHNSSPPLWSAAIQLWGCLEELHYMCLVLVLWPASHKFLVHYSDDLHPATWRMLRAQQQRVEHNAVATECVIVHHSWEWVATHWVKLIMWQMTWAQW